MYNNLKKISIFLIFISFGGYFNKAKADFSISSIKEFGNVIAQKTGISNIFKDDVDLSSITQSDLKELESLVTQRITVADILKAEHKNKYIGKSILSWAIEGSALVSIDLSSMKFEHDKKNNILKVTLPEPEISDFKIDHMATETFDVKQAILDDDKLITFIKNKAMRKAEEALMFKINHTDYKDRSKKEAIKILSKFFLNQHAFSDIQFKWQPNRKVALKK